jgi:hypothetical protein
LRPAFEWILLAASLVAGLGVVGSCAFTGSGAITDDSVNLVLAMVFAIVLVGAVYLLTTMSRDLRRLRERYVDHADVSAAPAETPAPGESTRADT